MAGTVVFPSINPYTEGAGVGANNWGLNYKGVTATLPS